MEVFPTQINFHSTLNHENKQKYPTKQKIDQLKLHLFQLLKPFLLFPLAIHEKLFSKLCLRFMMVDLNMFPMNGLNPMNGPMKNHSSVFNLKFSNFPSN